jgi:hypothetical protein
MTRALLAAVVLCAIVVGGGLVLFRRVFGDAPADDVVTTAPSAPRIDEGGSSDAGVAPPPAETQARLSTVRGSVQVRTGDGPWHDAAAGDPLDALDAVRAGRDAEAVIVAGAGVEVRLSPRSEVSVREIGEAAARLRIEEGHLTARVDGARRRVLRVQARGSDAVAESRDGSFGVVADGQGQVAVAAETGSVRLTAAGASVDVAAGQSSTAIVGAAPSAPATTPGSLFLKIGALGATHTKETSTVVQGETTPGAVVRVGAVSAAADAAGRFSLQVPLQDGRNELAVEVVDAVGRAGAERLPPVVVDRNKPGIDAAVRWGR